MSTRVRYFEPELERTGGAILQGIPEKVSDLPNDSGFVDAAGAAAAAPVQSVNGMTGAVKVISDAAPDATSTAAQCLAYAQAHPNVMFTWAKWAAATYTPVQTSGSWVYTLYTTYTDSGQYTVFEAANNTTGDLYRCKADGTWVRLAAEPTRVTANLSADVSTANATWTTLTSITLDPGVWLVNAVANFPSNATGIRRLILSGASGTSGSTRYWDDISPAVSGGVTFCRFTGMTKITSQTTYYLRAYQTSGADMTVSQYSGVDAIRLI